MYVYADSITNQTTLLYSHTLTSKKTSNLNDAQISKAVNMAKNSTKFQSLVAGYNYTFDGAFEYRGSNPPTNSMTRVYAIDFTVYNYSRPIHPMFEFIRVWIDPAIAKVFDATTGGTSWWGGPGGPAIAPTLSKLCDKSPACYLSWFSIPSAASSICDTPSGCDVIGSSGYSIHLDQSSVKILPSEGSSTLLIVVTLGGIIGSAAVGTFVIIRKKRK